MLFTYPLDLAPYTLRLQSRCWRRPRPTRLTRPIRHPSYGRPALPIAQ